MQNFQDTFEKHKQSFYQCFSICIAVPLISQIFEQVNVRWVLEPSRIYNGTFFYNRILWKRSIIWRKVFKSGLSKFCGRQPLKNLLSPLLNTLSHMCLKGSSLRFTKCEQLLNSAGIGDNNDTIYILIYFRK